jgi:hypothetical protein
MQDLIGEAIRAAGWILLKLATAGRYKSAGSSTLLVEGGVGLAAIGGALWVAYRWWLV